MASQDWEEHDHPGRREWLRQVWKPEGGQAKGFQRDLCSRTKYYSRRHEAKSEERQRMVDSDTKFPHCCLKSLDCEDKPILLLG